MWGGGGGGGAVGGDVLLTGKLDDVNYAYALTLAVD